MTDVLAELKRRIAVMSAEDKRKLDELVADELNRPWTPSPGPQTDAYLSQADLLLYGGSAGGGKTDLLLGLAMNDHRRSAIFRAQYVDLRGIEERLLELNGGRDGWNGQDFILRKGDRIIELGALAKPGAEDGWQGRPHDFIGFDEGAQLAVAKVQFVLGWLRSADASVRCRAVIASNPPIGAEGDWMIEWFAPWLDDLHENPAAPGELRWAVTHKGETRWCPNSDPVVLDGEVYTPLSRTFIPAFLDDNPFLRETGYRARVQNLPEPLRSKLLKGDFAAGKTDHPMQVIPSDWVDLAQGRHKRLGKTRNTMDAIGVDVAQGGLDKTILSALYGTYFDVLESHEGVDTKNGPDVAALVVKKLRDRANVVIDLTGGWGISARDHLEGISNIVCEGVVFSEKSIRKSKEGDFVFANMRSELWWRFREALDPMANKDDEMPRLPLDKRLKAQLCAPQWHLKGDRLFIESKDDLRKRLGSSTDEADAVIMAWHGRDGALRGPGKSRRYARGKPDLNTSWMAS